MINAVDWAVGVDFGIDKRDESRDQNIICAVERYGIQGQR